MKSTIIFWVGLFFSATSAYGGNGDLIVEGSVGIGTASPSAKLHIVGNTVIEASSPTTNTLFLTGDQSAVVHKNSAGTMKWLEGLRSDNGGAVDNFTFWNPSSGFMMALTQNGSVGIGTTNPGSYRLYVSGTAYSTGGWQGSDAKFKKNVQPINDGLGKILAMNGVTYEWKIEEYKAQGFPEGRHYGVIAQEVEKILPEIVKEGPDSSKSVAYTEIIPVLIEAIKEQQKEIDRLKESLTERK